ncbi:MAG TPA: hypothetical protein VFP84_33045 [Kofleriaceae bacterium]|nr:hypothetical protein [Kofleriaceae bacterium]
MRRLCLALVFAGACAGSPSTGTNAPAPASPTQGSTTANDDPNAVECHEETPIGSNLPRRICRSKLDNQMDHQGAQDWHSGVPATPTSSH